MLGVLHLIVLGVYCLEINMLKVHGVCVDKDMEKFFQILGHQLDHFVSELVFTYLYLFHHTVNTVHVKPKLMSIISIIMVDRYSCRPTARVSVHVLLMFCISLFKAFSPTSIN